MLFCNDIDNYLMVNSCLKLIVEPKGIWMTLGLNFLYLRLLIYSTVNNFGSLILDLWWLIS